MKLILGLILMVGCAMAQNAVPNPIAPLEKLTVHLGPEEYKSETKKIETTSLTGPQFLIFGGLDGKEKLRISQEGIVTFGEGVKPDAATKEFAKFLREYMRSPICVEKPVGDVAIGDPLTGDLGVTGDPLTHQKPR